MDKYAVIGNPITHSLSPLIHQLFAKQTDRELMYTTIEAAIDGFADAVAEFKAAGGKGMNVTAPFKLQAFNIAQTTSPLAIKAKAANVLAFNKAGEIFADNSDGPGLIQDLTHNLNCSLRMKKILLLGAGGAAHGVIASLLEQAPSELVIANRTKQRAIALAEHAQFAGSLMGVGLDELGESPYDIILNTTNAGLNGDALKLPNSIIGNHTICYDLMYGKQGTPFLEWARTHNASKCADGLGMLVEQAAVAFYLWHGVYPQTQAVIQQLRQTT